MEGCSWRGDEPRCPRVDATSRTSSSITSPSTAAARGELVVAAAVAPRAVELFRRLWQLGFPIRQLRLVDDYDASDDASMTADNSSAFNFRADRRHRRCSRSTPSAARSISTPSRIRGASPTASCPPPGAAFADRTDLRPGMIVRPGPVVAALDELGWEWGGDWRHAFDDHHVVWSRAV